MLAGYIQLQLCCLLPNPNLRPNSNPNPLVWHTVSGRVYKNNYYENIFQSFVKQLPVVVGAYPHLAAVGAQVCCNGCGAGGGGTAPGVVGCCAVGPLALLLLLLLLLVPLAALPFVDDVGLLLPSW